MDDLTLNKVRFVIQISNKYVTYHALPITKVRNKKVAPGQTVISLQKFQINISFD